jgi:hypothetical protein
MQLPFSAHSGSGARTQKQPCRRRTAPPGCAQEGQPRPGVGTRRSPSVRPPARRASRLPPALAAPWEGAVTGSGRSRRQVPAAVGADLRRRSWSRGCGRHVPVLITAAWLFISMEILPQLPPPPPPPRLRTCGETQTARAREQGRGLGPARPSPRLPRRPPARPVTGEGTGRKLASRAPEARAKVARGLSGEPTLPAGSAASLPTPSGVLGEGDGKRGREEIGDCAGGRVT